jgi:hypothetical protein
MNGAEGRRALVAELDGLPWPQWQQLNSLYYLSPPRR